MELNELRKNAEAATPGPWQWGPERSHWGDCGPNLETVERGPLYEDGSQGAAAEVVGSWGHDANGIFVKDHDKAFIATFDPPTVLALLSRLEQAERDRDKLRNRLDAMRRQRDGYRNQLRKTEQQVQRVRELAGKGTDALLRMNIRSDGLYLSQAILEALDGDGRG